jgi:hypothetical protein
VLLLVLFHITNIIRGSGVKERWLDSEGEGSSILRRSQVRSMSRAVSA